MSRFRVVLRRGITYFGDAWYAPVAVIEGGMSENFTLRIPDRAQRQPDIAEFEARLRDLHDPGQGAIEQLRECALPVEGMASPVVGLQYRKYDDSRAA